MSTSYSLHHPTFLRLPGSSSVFSPLTRAAGTLYLFTKGDHITLLVPSTLYGTLATSDPSLSYLVLRIAWVWLNLLHFCVSNQLLSPAEDAANKPWRPLPAGRISPSVARTLRWALLPACLFASAQLGPGALWASALLILATLANNEFGGGDGWWGTRGALVAVGYAGFNWGAAAVCSPGGTYDPAAIGRAQLAFALVVLTTIPAQDFRDVIGDAQIGRKTFPMLYPAASRVLIPLSLIAWSMLLPELWHTGPVLGSVLGALGLTTAVRFWLWRHAEADRKSYYLYNIWLCIVLAMSVLGV